MAIESRAGADLGLGRYGELAGELEALCREHPLRERLWELLILALYRSGRQAEALRAYTEIRARLVDELGIEPGQPLRELQARILAQDPSLGPASAPAGPAPAQVVEGVEARLRDAERWLDTMAGIRQGSQAPPAEMVVVDEEEFRAAAKQGIGGNYVRRLLAAVGETEHDSPVEQALIEPLSERELDVLRLLGTDLDGPDIARELMVSLNTVRTHTKHIYAKLAVTNRRAAVRRAQELSLSRTHNRQP